LSGDYLDSGYLSGKVNVFTAPTEVNEYNAHTNMRLDYIFISKSLKSYLKSYEVIKNALTQKASDHFPVLLELSID